MRPLLNPSTADMKRRPMMKLQLSVKLLMISLKRMTPTAPNTGPKRVPMSPVIVIMTTSPRRSLDH